MLLEVNVSGKWISRDWIGIFLAFVARSLKSSFLEEVRFIRDNGTESFKLSDTCVRVCKWI